MKDKDGKPLKIGHIVKVNFYGSKFKAIVRRFSEEDGFKFIVCEPLVDTTMKLQEDSTVVLVPSEITKCELEEII